MEAEVRRFRLINSLSQVYDLMETSNFLHSPSGLGINRNNTFLNLGNRFVRVNKKFPQPEPSGIIAFTGDSNYEIYQKYHEFVRFTVYEPLKLKYFTGSDEYTMDVVVKSLEKTEINEQGYLDCTIQFAGLTPWYKFITIDYLDGGGLTPAETLYPKDGLTPRDPVSVPKFYENAGTLDALTKLTIYGPINNPEWQWSTGQGKVNAQIASNECLVVDCTEEKYRIYKTVVRNGYATNLIDLYDQSDFSTKRFVTFPAGMQCYFQMQNLATSAPTTKPTRIVLEIMECHESI